MSRRLLHRTKIDEFKFYLSDNGIEFRDGRGDYQVMQVLIGKDWMCVYDRNKGDHFTVDVRMESLVKRFINTMNGVSKLASDIASNNIIEIIKSPKQWTDEDMIKAFIASSWNEISCNPLTAEQWLEQYKVVKNG